MTSSNSTVVWRWDQQEPFSVNVPDGNPSGLGAFEFPLRFPGQYFDRETNLHCNYYRDYDPSIGGYKESDLIGLRGGLNTYAYVSSSPLSFIDAFGLQRGGLPRGAKTLFEQLIESITGETAKAISGAESFGKSLGDRVCKGGGVPRGPLIDCADCIRLFPEYETQEACFKGCRETIEKCTRTPGPRSECPVPAQS